MRLPTKRLAAMPRALQLGRYARLSAAVRWYRLPPGPLPEGALPGATPASMPAGCHDMSEWELDDESALYAWYKRRNPASADILFEVKPLRARAEGIPKFSALLAELKSALSVVERTPRDLWVEQLVRDALKLKQEPADDKAAEGQQPDAVAHSPNMKLESRGGQLRLFLPDGGELKGTANVRHMLSRENYFNALQSSAGPRDAFLLRLVKKYLSMNIRNGTEFVQRVQSAMKSSEEWQQRQKYCGVAACVPEIDKHRKYEVGSQAERDGLLCISSATAGQFVQPPDPPPTPASPPASPSLAVAQYTLEGTTAEDASITCQTLGYTNVPLARFVRAVEKKAHTNNLARKKLRENEQVVRAAKYCLGVRWMHEVRQLGQAHDSG